MRKPLQSVSSTLDPSHLFGSLSPRSRIVGVVFLSLLNIAFLVASSYLLKYLSQITDNPYSSNIDEETPSEDPSTPSYSIISITPDPFIPEFIDLQWVVDDWLATTRVNAGIMIYDLDNDRIAAEHQANKVFSVASVYKLFYVYDGYAQIAAGNVDIDQPYVTTKDYRAGTYTFPECLDLMVRESYNGCADAMYENPIMGSRVDNLISNLNLTNTSSHGLRSTAQDLTTLLKHFLDHPDFSNQLYDNFLDSMLYQPPTQVTSDTIHNWRQGLPSGFSDDVLVYDKVGWEWNGKSWNIFADAAIVEFPEQERHYIMVILTSGLPSADTRELTRLGKMLESAIKN